MHSKALIGWCKHIFKGLCKWHFDTTFSTFLYIDLCCDYWRMICRKYHNQIVLLRNWSHLRLLSRILFITQIKPRAMCQMTRKVKHVKPPDSLFFKYQRKIYFQYICCHRFNDIFVCSDLTTHWINQMNVGNIWLLCLIIYVSYLKCYGYKSIIW